MGKKTLINRLASSEKIKLLVKSAIKIEWLIQNEHFPYIQIIFRNSKRTIANVKKIKKTNRIFKYTKTKNFQNVLYLYYSSKH